jgi:NADPH:quinone reductase-like Zn-dependent oxidoreductase
MPRWVTEGGDLSRLALLGDGPRSRGGGHPGPGCASVSVTHCGLNLADVFAALGLYSATPEGEFTPGLEFAGVVAEIAPGSSTE